MKKIVAILFLIVFSQLASARDTNYWRGVHFWISSDESALELKEALPALARVGVNAIVMEVNYSFEFQAHPELRSRRFVTRATAHALAAAARTNGIELIPEFNCLGHQSFAHRASPLLRVHPEFNETPSLNARSKGVYCLSWCPRAPGLHDIVFSLMDEIAGGFEARYLHVGMDEVYLIGEDECPRCRGANPAKLFADEVNALRDHIVKKKGLGMLMWADRLIGPKYQGWSEFDNPRNNLSAALGSVPADVILCDWHYEKRDSYPSIPFLAGKGYRVWPAGFRPVDAAQAFSDYAWTHRSNVVGFLTTTWTSVPIAEAADWPPIKDVIPRWIDITK